MEFYKKVIDLKDSWLQEKYNACIEVYTILEELKRVEEGISYLIESHSYDKTRVEGIYRLIKHYCIKGQPEVSMAFYGLIQNWYEHHYDPKTISSRLFAKKAEYDFYLPYYMIIVADRLKKRELGVRMYQRIFDRGYIPGSWWAQNLIYNLQFFIADLPINADFCYKMITYVDHLSLKQEHRVIVEQVINHFRPSLGSPTTMISQVVRHPVRIMLTMTSCKRLDLFQQTVNSILKTWTDLDKVDAFFCVDDNSSETDRDMMRSQYPFFEYYMKGPSEKGHRQSMNIIWNKLREVKPVYWIHLEDDWLFFKREAYVGRSVKTLETYEHLNVHQILFNRNYGELYATHGWDLGGGKVLDTHTLLHVKDMKVEGRNCSYWPHYSFRPSMVRVSKILELGNYDSPNTFFEQEYANRWTAKGFQSAFFNTISCLHTGKLTSDKSGINAYILNEVKQFGGKTPPNTFVVNLKRRPDRKTAIQTLFKQHNIHEYHFFEAVDGQGLVLSLELAKMFHGNDFGSRRGFIGCALSHLNLWKQLIASDQEYYTIFEDDITFTENFKEQYSKAQGFLKEGTADILFLGYSSYKDSARSDTCENSPFPSLNTTKYVGGTFAYCITKEGAKKIVTYIETNGIKHGIDYLMVRVSDVKYYSVQPHIVLSDWVNNSTNVDSDIQKDNASIILSKVTHPENWIFYPGLDSGKDIKYIGRKSVSDLMLTAELTEGCVAFNTLGFLKSDIQWPLVTTPWLKEKDGIYIHRSVKRPKTRVKMLCNWCSSEQLCREWNTMSKGNYTWNNIEITWSDTDIDYWVIINRPPSNAHYVPEKTIVFQMEPWCGEPWQTWGVKTWGLWAKPDPTKFLQVRSHDNYYNNAFWQLNMTYHQLKNETPQKTMENRISSICSSKYFDLGHKFRIDFLKFIDAKNDPIVQVDVWNTDNQHGFRSYKGPVLPHKDKELGLVPYKYYFMCENNVERNFITEKLWEPIITETLVFYWGCPNVKDYIDERAYVQLDMFNFETSFQLIKKAIAENWWEARLPYIRATKAKILDYYQFFPTLERVIEDHKKQIPIVIVSHNNYKYVRNTLLQLESINKEYLKNIIIMDNNSTDSDTINYLKDLSGHRIIWKKTNDGPWITTTINTDIYNILPDKFILTDPDLEFNRKLPPNFIEILNQLSDECKAYKIGFALDISDFDKMFQEKYCVNKTIYEWELENWNKDRKIDHPTFELYKTGIDTTFCLINKKSLNNTITVRVAGDFTAKHIPWYIENPIYNSSELFNLAKNSSNISTIKHIILDKYSKVNKNNDWIYFEDVDSGDYDITSIGRRGAHELLEKADETPGCVAVNTIGFMKHFVKLPLSPSPWFKKGDGIWINRYAYELSKIHSTLQLKYERWGFDGEYPEQRMAYRFLKGDEKVLELGSNIGRNSLVIAAILKDQSQFVTMECDPNSVKKVSENRDINSMTFHIEPSALSNKSLIQNQWTTKPSIDVEPGWTRVNTITYDELVAKYKINFDTLIADCEGALYYILQDMPKILTNMRLIIMENDYHDITQKHMVDGILREAGFERIYKEAGGWGPCYDFFYETWKRM